MSADTAEPDVNRLKAFLGPKSEDATAWDAVSLRVEEAEDIVGADAVAATIAGLGTGPAWACLTDRVLYREDGDWQAVFAGDDPDPTVGRLLSAEFALDGEVGIGLRHIDGDRWRKVTLREGTGGDRVLARRWSLVSVLEGQSLVYRVYWRLEGEDFPRYRPFAQRFCGFETTA